MEGPERAAGMGKEWYPLQGPIGQCPAALRLLCPSSQFAAGSSSPFKQGLHLALSPELPLWSGLVPSLSRTRPAPKIGALIACPWRIRATPALGQLASPFLPTSLLVTEPSRGRAGKWHCGCPFGCKTCGFSSCNSIWGKFWRLARKKTKHSIWKCCREVPRELQLVISTPDLQSSTGSSLAMLSLGSWQAGSLPRW